MRWALIGICASLAAGCSTLPATNKVEAFGTATAASSALIQNIADANRKLAVALGEETQAERYMAGGGYSIATKPVTTYLLKQDNVTLRLTALRALEEYGKALKLASDQGRVDQLEQASLTLGAAIGGLAGAASSPGVAPAAKIVSRSVGFLLANAYAEEIRAVIAARDPDVQLLVATLKQDFRSLPRALPAQLGALIAQREVNMDRIRQTVTDPLGRYQTFKLARQDMAEQEALAEAAKRLVPVLDGLAEAHAALAAEEPSAELAIRRFVALTNDVADLAGAVVKKKETAGDT